MDGVSLEQLEHTLSQKRNATFFVSVWRRPNGVQTIWKSASVKRNYFRINWCKKNMPNTLGVLNYRSKLWLGVKTKSRKILCLSWNNIKHYIKFSFFSLECGFCHEQWLVDSHSFENALLFNIVIIATNVNCYIQFSLCHVLLTSMFLFYLLLCCCLFCSNSMKWKC